MNNYLKIEDATNELSFLPDPMREITLAAKLISGLMNAAGKPEDLTDVALKVMRQSAIRIFQEIEDVQSARSKKL